MVLVDAPPRGRAVVRGRQRRHPLVAALALRDMAELVDRRERGAEHAARCTKPVASGSGSESLMAHQAHARHS